MASVRTPKPVLLMVAVFSRHPEAIVWAREQLAQQYGPVGIESEAFSFHHTSYYDQEMGRDLRKQFFGFHNLTTEDCLPAVKHHTNDLEQMLAGQNRFPEPRPVNLDPGILTLGKFLLATTKDQQHRIYLRDGIYAEVTLRYMDGQFQPWPWTYADYREPDLHRFLIRAREYYRQRLSDLLAARDFAN
jgi:hypothetical protein